MISAIFGEYGKSDFYFWNVVHVTLVKITGLDLTAELCIGF